MPNDSLPVPRRAPFLDAGGDAASRRLLRLLLAQDGSTTRLREAIAGGPFALTQAAW